MTVLESAGLKKASDAPQAEAASGTFDYEMQHCNAGPMVASATIRDPDNLDTGYGDGDEITITFTVDTLKPSVASKWDIDKLVTFCTAAGLKWRRPSPQQLSTAPARVLLRPRALMQVP